MIDTRNLLGGPKTSGADVLDCVVVGGGPADAPQPVVGPHDRGAAPRRQHETVAAAGPAAARIVRAPRLKATPLLLPPLAYP